MLLAHHAWQELFGADPLIIGQRITLNDRPRTVIGVMGPGFRLPRGSDDVWIPLVFSAFERQARGSHRLLAIGRLKPGVTLAQAQADMDTIASQLAANFPRYNAREGLLVEPIREEMSGALRQPLTIVMAAVLMVMLIASINVANLLLARACRRQQEIAVRLAMGAPRRRLVRQLLTESTFLSALGCLGGIVLAAVAVAGLRSFLPPAITTAGSITLNLPILVFGVALALISGLLFGMAPVLQLSNRTGNTALNDAPRGSSSARVGRTTRALVAAEISLAVVFLVAGGLLIRSFTRLAGVDPGFRLDSALTFTIEFPRSRYPDPARWAPALDDLMARLAALPGVSAAGAISWLPLTNTGGSNALFVEGYPLPAPGADTFVVYRMVTPDYFRALGIPLRTGRVFDASDGVSSSRVVIINESMARKYWPEASPLGRRVSFAREAREEDWMTVVGVVGDTKQFALNESIRHRDVRATYPGGELVPSVARRGARERRCARPGGRGPCRGARRRSADACVGGPDARRDRLRHRRARAFWRRVDRGICRCLPPARRDRRLRAALVHGGLAHPRDWCACGAWRGCAHDHEDDCPRRARRCGSRPDGRSDRSTQRQSTAESVSLRGRPDRFRDVRLNHRDSHRRGDGRLLCAGASRRAG